MPIRPEEVVTAKREQIPQYVFDAFDELIVKNFDGHSATVKQKEVVSLIIKNNDISRQKLFDNHWLDIEDIYREAGWHVKYDSPAYCENYDEYFVFTPKKK